MILFLIIATENKKRLTSYAYTSKQWVYILLPALQLQNKIL